jgi:hypothetical protein
VALVRHLPAEAWERTGTVSIGTVSVRVVAYLMVGHEKHHLRIIQEKYLGHVGDRHQGGRDPEAYEVFDRDAGEVAARGLYHSLGFYDISPYHEVSERLRLVLCFMELGL